MAEQTSSGGAELAVVVQRSYDLALWILRKVEKFPRSFRYGVGDRMAGRALDLVEILTAAAYTADKSALLEEANRTVNALRLLLRMGFDLKLLGADAQEFAAGQLEEIGRMIGGWRKAVARKS